MWGLFLSFVPHSAPPILWSHVVFIICKRKDHERKRKGRNWHFSSFLSFLHLWGIKMCFFFVLIFINLWWQFTNSKIFRCHLLLKLDEPIPQLRPIWWLITPNSRRKKIWGLYGEKMTIDLSSFFNMWGLWAVKTNLWPLQSLQSTGSRFF